jgi:hypothetical protein
MEQTHVLAVVSRAKAIARQGGHNLRDEILGYLCACSDIDGSWWSLLKASPPDTKAPAAGASADPCGSLKRQTGPMPFVDLNAIRLPFGSLSYKPW